MYLSTDNYDCSRMENIISLSKVWFSYQKEFSGRSTWCQNTLFVGVNKQLNQVSHLHHIQIPTKTIQVLSNSLNISIKQICNLLHKIINIWIPNQLYSWIRNKSTYSNLLHQHWKKDPKIKYWRYHLGLRNIISSAATMLKQT